MKATEWLLERAFHQVALKADEIRTKSKNFHAAMELICQSVSICGGRKHELVCDAIEILNKSKFNGKLELIELVNKYCALCQEEALEQYDRSDNFHAEISYGYRTVVVRGRSHSCRMVINQICDEMQQTSPYDRLCYQLVNDTTNEVIVQFAR